MARLEDSGNKGLPRPPAPPRRGANPWRLSGTARKAEPRSEPISERLLEELINQAPVDKGPAHEEAPPQATPSRARPGLWFLVIAGVVILVALRMFFEARAKGDWARLIGPLVLIAFIAHGWWRARQRREARKTTPR